MKINNNIIFGQSFKTKDIAEMIAGKKPVDCDCLSKITGISQDTLKSQYNSDIFQAGSHYCISKFSKINPEFEELHKESKKIKEKLKEELKFGEPDSKKINNLFANRDKKIKETCLKLGAIIDIPQFNIPFFTDIKK